MATTIVTVVSVNVGQPRTLGDPGTRHPLHKQWRSGIFKVPVDRPVRVTPLNVAGDAQADLRVHGGPDKAILAYAADHYPCWNDELTDIRPMGPGAFGENLTLAGIAEETVCIGDVWRIDDVLLQVSQPRQPCWKLARRWELPQLPKLVVNTGRTGWYLRVLREGTIQAGLPCELSERPHPRWTVARANRALFDKTFSVAEAQELAGLAELAVSWREDLLGAIHAPGRT